MLTGSLPTLRHMTAPGRTEGLLDETLLEEIELVSELVLAASAEPTRRLTTEEIDRALGLLG